MWPIRKNIYSAQQKIIQKVPSNWTKVHKLLRNKVNISVEKKM